MSSAHRIAYATVCLLAFAPWAQSSAAAIAPLQCSATAQAVANGKLSFVLRANAGGVKVYEEMNSWGYENRFFTANVAGAKQMTIARRPMAWSENVFAVRTLDRGESLVTKIDLCDGTWAVKPATLHGPQTLILTPHFRNLDDERNVGVWTGEITGAPVTVHLNDTCTGWLDKQY